MMKQWLKLRVVSDTRVIRFLEAACFVAAGLIPVLAFRKFADSDLSEAQLLVGVIAAMSMALFYTALGVLLEFKAKAT